MYCNYCGNKIEDEAKFCSKCGKMVAVATEAKEEQKTVVYENPVIEKEKDAKKSVILKYAILGLAFAAVGLLVLITLVSTSLSLYSIERSYAPLEPGMDLYYVPYAIMGLISSILTVPLSALGLHFSLKAGGFVRAYVADYGETDGRATVGKSLSIPGKFISIVALGLTFFSVVLFTILLIL